MANPAAQTNREYAACPHIPAADVTTVADQAGLDAQDLIVDVHDLDPRQIWGRLALWHQTDPKRLIAAAVALAGMHNPNTPGSVLDANIHTATPNQAAA